MIELLEPELTGDDEFEEEDHGAVTFVPLIGEEGWREPDEVKREAAIHAEHLPARYLERSKTATVLLI